MPTDKRLKLIFMGTPHFALPSLQALADSPHEIVAIYTQPPRPAGRGQKERPSPVHAFALEHKIPVFTPASLKSPEAQEAFRAHNADAAIVAAYGLLLPPAILQGTRLGCINVHPSLLPRWRGAAPIARAVMAGDRETGIVIMQMDEGLDTGNMLLVRHFPIPDGTTTGELHDRLAQEAGPMLLDVLERFSSIIPVKQPEDGVAYARKIIKEECRIDWRETAASVRNKVLGLSPSPGAFFMHAGEAVKVFSAELSSGQTAPGTTLDEALTVACGEGALRLLLLQRPGKKPVAAAELLRGWPVPAKTQLE